MRLASTLERLRHGRGILMLTIGILGDFPNDEFANALLSAIGGPETTVLTTAGAIKRATEGISDSEVVSRLFEGTDLLLVAFSDVYLKQLRDTRRLEYELIVATMSKTAGRLVPLRYESGTTMPPIFASLQLYDVIENGLAPLAESLRGRIQALSERTRRLAAHPRIHSVLKEAFPGKLVSSKSGPVTVRDQNVGYEIFSIVDPDFGNLTVVHTYEPITIRNTVEHITNHYGLFLKGPLYLIASRDRLAPNPTVRLEHLRSQLGATHAWYVDTFIAERLAWKPASFNKNVPVAKPYFVEPRVRSSDGNNERLALAHLQQWHQDGTPIMVVQGPGGIGKTQLLRKFASEISAKHDVVVIYLDSVSVIDFSRNHNLPLNDFSIDTISEIVSNLPDVGRVTKERLETLLTSDRFLVILDGLDEIIPRLPTGYAVTDFFTAVQEVVEGLEGGRLLVSCRTSFWETGLTPLPIAVTVLDAFDEQQVNKYFENRFSEQSLSRDRCTRVIAEMQRYFRSEIYPFMLDLACRIADTPDGKIADKTPDEQNSFDDGQLLDEVLWHVCRREAAKFGNEGLNLEELPLDVTLQTAFLTEIALHMRQLPGCMSSEDAKSHLEQSLGRRVSSPVFAAFKSHPLLDTDQDEIRFAYDFVQEFFLALGVKQGLHLAREISPDQAYVLTGLCRLDSNFLRTLARKAGPLSDDITLGISDLIAKFKKKRLEDWDTHIWNRCVGGAVNIGLQCLLLQNKWDVEQATKYLHDLFAMPGSPNRLKDLVLLAPNSESRITFSFENTAVDGAGIVDYDNFLNCKFDATTRFTNAVIFGGKFSSQVKSSARAVNFDDTCALDERIRNVIRNRDRKDTSSDNSAERHLKGFVRSFRAHGTYHKPRDPEMLQRGFNHSAIPFQKMLQLTIDSGLVATGVGMGGKFLGIDSSAIEEVEDFVEQGIQGSRIRAALKRIGTL